MIYEFAFIYKCLSTNQNATYSIESFMCEYKFPMHIIFDPIHEKKLFSSTRIKYAKTILRSYIWFYKKKLYLL